MEQPPDWANATAGGPLHKFGGTFTEDDLNPGLGRSSTWCPDFLKIQFNSILWKFKFMYCDVIVYFYLPKYLLYTYETVQQIFTLLRKVFVPKYWEEIKIQFRSLTIISQDFVVPIYISTRGNTWRKYGNGDASSKAAFVKSSIQFGSMMLWRPSYFVSNTYHQAEASFKSKSQSVQSSSGMLVLRLL